MNIFMKPQAKPNRALRIGARIVIATSIVLNVVLILGSIHLNQKFGELWLQRWKAENRAKAAESSLKFVNQMLATYETRAHSTQELDAWMERNAAEARQRATQELQESERHFSEIQTRQRIDDAEANARTAADRLASQIREQNDQLQQLQSQHEWELRRLEDRLDSQHQVRP